MQKKKSHVYISLHYQEMKSQGVEENRLQLLCDVSGAFRPGVLTALVGVSGAGKTTLMDVLAGRKTGGYIEGSISISGFPKNQETFARVSGYCEQNDIHSPCVTIHESLVYSAWLRLSQDVDQKTRKACLLLPGFCTNIFFSKLVDSLFMLYLNITSIFNFMNRYFQFVPNLCLHSVLSML